MRKFKITWVIFIVVMLLLGAIGPFWNYYTLSRVIETPVTHITNIE